MIKQLKSPHLKIAVFKRNLIRKTLYQDEWYFSIIDIVQVLTESTYANRYWSDLKIQLSEKEGYLQLYEKIVRLKLEAPDGKNEGNRYCEYRNDLPDYPVYSLP
jgi:hypothetical protein